MASTPTKTELLAPAGTIEAGLTALDAGADAIYVGLPRFNARERGQNCTTDEVAKLIAYAHHRSRKVYVTLNTLIKQSELSEVAELLPDLMAMRPDAIIVQDLGVMRMIREHAPELTLHASTQMGIHNSAGARIAEAMGIKRVILERQVTYEEITDIQRHSNIELEVFIHGALCCGQSGSCLFSSWMGGWSGNRGRCKQACRRRYFSEEGNGFFFSPKDLYSLEAIPQLTQMGIASLKIEGRLRKPDYVGNAVSAYRLMLDTPPEEHAKALPEAKRILSHALGRKWTQPFRTESDFEGTVQHRSMGTSGRLIGTVQQSKPSGFTAKLSSPLHLDDTIRVQPPSGDEGPAIVVTSITIDRRSCRRASAGQTCWIACDKPVTAGSRIFKTASHGTDMQDRIAKLPQPGTTIDVDIAISASSASVTLPLTGSRWERDIETQPAQKRPLEAASVEDEFAKTRLTAIVTGTVRADVAPDLFLPQSQLKALRREFWEWCAANLSEKQLREAYASRLADIALSVIEPTAKPQPDNAETVVLMSGSRPSPVPGAIIARDICDMTPQTDEAVLPEFCPEAKVEALRDQVRAAYAKGVRRFRVRSLYGLDLLNELKGISVSATYPLPVCNSLAHMELQRFGVSRTTAWVELEEGAINDLFRHIGEGGELLTYARLPLLSTRMEIPVSGEIKDARGARFVVEHGTDTTLLLPDKVFALDTNGTRHRFIDLTHAEWGEQSSSTFNYHRDWA